MPAYQSGISFAYGEKVIVEHAKHSHRNHEVLSKPNQDSGDVLHPFLKLEILRLLHSNG